MSSSAHEDGAYERPADLPRFKSPPVTHVSFEMFYEPLLVRTIDLHKLIEVWLPEFPNLTEHRPAPSLLGSSRSGLRVEVADDPPIPRIRFLSGDGVRAIDFQDDLLRLRWIKTRDEEYPSYETLRELFVSLALDLAAFKDSHINVVALGLRYLNSFEVDRADPVSALVHSNSLSRDLRDDPDPTVDSAKLELKHTYRTEEGEKFASLDVRSFVRPLDDGRSVNRFNLRYSGDPFAAPAPEETGGFDRILRFFDAGHEAIVRTFAARTSADLHHRWERFQ